MKTVFRSLIEEEVESLLSEVAPPGREQQVLALKKVKGVNPYAIAWAQHKKHGEPKNESELEETEGSVYGAQGQMGVPDARAKKDAVLEYAQKATASTLSEVCVICDPDEEPLIPITKAKKKPEPVGFRYWEPFLADLHVEEDTSDIEEE